MEESATPQTAPSKAERKRARKQLLEQNLSGQAAPSAPPSAATTRPLAASQPLADARDDGTAPVDEYAQAWGPHAKRPRRDASSAQPADEASSVFAVQASFSPADGEESDDDLGITAEEVERQERARATAKAARTPHILDRIRAGGTETPTPAQAQAAARREAAFAKVLSACRGDAILTTGTPACETDPSLAAADLWAPFWAQRTAQDSATVVEHLYKDRKGYKDLSDLALAIPDWGQ